MDKQEELEHSLNLRGIYKSKLEEIKNNSQGCNDKHYEDLKEGLKNYDYWTFENNNGRFVFTDKGLFFQSQMVDKNFERFPFFEDYYFHFKKRFIDYAVIGFEDKIFLLCLFEDKKIKPLRISGCFCGDIVVYDATKVTDFHYSCGHAMINNEKCVVVKSFREDISGYHLQKISGNNFTGLY